MADRRLLRAGASLALLCAGATGCVSGSAHHAAGPVTSGSGSPSPSAAPSATETPAIDPQNQGLDSLGGTATITQSGGTSAPVRVATSADSSSQVSVDATGHMHVEITMQGGGGALFSLSGPAAVGPVAGDHVSALLPSAGVLIDTEQGNTCTVTYTKASESEVAGSARCDAQNGPQTSTVTINFLLR